MGYRTVEEQEELAKAIGLPPGAKAITQKTAENLAADFVTDHVSTDIIRHLAEGTTRKGVLEQLRIQNILLEAPMAHGDPLKLEDDQKKNIDIAVAPLGKSFPAVDDGRFGVITDEEVAAIEVKTQFKSIRQNLGNMADSLLGEAVQLRAASPDRKFGIVFATGTYELDGDASKKYGKAVWKPSVSLHRQLLNIAVLGGEQNDKANRVGIILIDNDPRKSVVRAVQSVDEFIKLGTQHADKEAANAAKNLTLLYEQRGSYMYDESFVEDLLS